MAVNRRGDIGWFSPDPRAIIPLDERFHVPHGLRRVWKQCVVIAPVSGAVRRTAAGTAATTPQKFSITFDTDFESVICECAKRKEGTWISREIIESYCNLHRLGHAHSVEVWVRRQSERSEKSRPNDEMLRQAQHDSPRNLVGGLYGVHIGGAFFGESMFHHVPNASKVALVALVERLRQRGFVLLDTQWQTPHLAQFGTVEIPKREYLRVLAKAIACDCKF